MNDYQIADFTDDTNEILRSSFLSAFQEADALTDFYFNFKNNWQKNKSDFEIKYSLGIELNDILDNVFDCKNMKDVNDILQNCKIQERYIGDIINLNINIIDSKTNISYSMKPGFLDQDPQKARALKNKLNGQKMIFCRSILSNIIIIFERYLASVYQFKVITNPKIYFENKSIKISSLFTSSIPKIIVDEIRSEVENNMYDSLKTLDKLALKSSFNIDRHIPIRKEFEEIYYRRNIYIHNSGRANKIYLNNVDAKYKNNIKNGDKIICNDIYLENAIMTLKKVICVLYYELLISVDASLDNYDCLSETIGFSALSDGEYALSEYIYEILSKNKNFQFSDRVRFEVNRMIALKQQGKSIKEDLEKFDVSAMQEMFVIAKYCLQDNYEEVYLHLSKTYPNCLPASAIRDWPLFIDFRKSKQYKQFKEEHIDDFNKYEFEIDDNSSETENNTRDIDEDNM